MKAAISSILVLLLLFSSGCTIVDGGAIVVGDPRPPVSPSQVKIYRTPPKNYEEIAIVSSSAGHDFQSNSTLMNAAIERLKLEASRLGANGVILMQIKDRDAPVVTTSYGQANVYGYPGSAYATGMATSVYGGDRYTRLKGLAIFVKSEE